MCSNMFAVCYSVQSIGRFFAFSFVVLLASGLVHRMSLHLGSGLPEERDTKRRLLFVACLKYPCVQTLHNFTMHIQRQQRLAPLL